MSVRSTLTHLFALGLIALCAALPLSARALERITLRNGFTYDCSHRQSLADGHIRLFLQPNDTSDYIDLPASDIVSVAALPNPLPAPPPTPIAPAASASVTGVHDLLARAGAQHNIDVELLASLVHAESNYHAHAISRTGAGGLMQLMPGTARDLGVTDRFQPSQNIAGGTAYLDALLTRYNNNLALALAAYNAGPAAVDRFHGIPPYRETRAYVARVMTEFKRRKQQQLARTLEYTAHR